jgi:hypothetical protein
LPAATTAVSAFGRFPAPAFCWALPMALFENVRKRVVAKTQVHFFMMLFLFLILLQRYGIMVKRQTKSGKMAAAYS